MSLRNRLQTDPLDVVISWNLKRWVSTHQISESNRERLMEKASYLSSVRTKRVGRITNFLNVLQDLRHVLAFPAREARMPHGHVDYGRDLAGSQLIYSTADGHAVFHPFIGGSGIFYVIIPGLPG